MNRYGAGASRAGVNTANQAYFQLRPTGTTGRIYVTQLTVNIAVAPTTAPAFYLSRSTANGTITTTLAGQPLDPADPASIATWDSVFSVQPTFSTTAWIDSGALALTAGGSFIWSFYDAPLIITNATASGLVIANLNASGATTGTFTGSARWIE